MSTGHIEPDELVADDDPLDDDPPYCSSTPVTKASRTA
jgi:hypothetical protein